MLNVGVLQYGRGSRGIVVVALVLALVLLLVGGGAPLGWHLGILSLWGWNCGSHERGLKLQIGVVGH